MSAWPLLGIHALAAFVCPIHQGRPTTAMDGGSAGNAGAVFRPTAMRLPWMAEMRTTAWMHDSMDGGGRAASGTAAEEVEQRRERLPETQERFFPPTGSGHVPVMVEHYTGQWLQNATILS
jgi:hypothetical protein